MHKRSIKSKFLWLKFDFHEIFNDYKNFHHTINFNDSSLYIVQDFIFQHHSTHEL